MLHFFQSSVTQRMFFILLFIFTCLSFNPAPGHAQRIEFFVDHAQFRLQGNYVYLEIYYSITRKSFTFSPADDGFQAAGKIRTLLTRDTTTMVIDSLIIRDFVKNPAEISPTQRFAEVSAIQIEAGSYVLASEFTDLTSKQTVHFADSLQIVPFSSDSLQLSHIELANAISPQPKCQLKFDKNGIRVVPNASRIYGSGLLPKIFFYAEAYNLAFGEAAKQSTFHLNYDILDQQGNPVKQIPGSPKPKPGNSSIINGGVNVSDLASGFYTFRITITDDFNGQVATAQKNFYIYKVEDFVATATQPQAVAQQKDEFDDMDEKELNRQFDMVRYIASKDDKIIFKRLDVNGKRNFMKNFWREKDPDPKTTINEAKVTYYQLLDYANKNFSVGQKPGWKTDRARVLLIYGQPDEVERQPSSPGNKAYQIWYYYNLEGGVQFVFVDIRSVRDFELVHSTHRSEVHDTEWRQRYLKY